MQERLLESLQESMLNAEVANTHERGMVKTPPPQTFYNEGRRESIQSSMLTALTRNSLLDGKTEASRQLNAQLEFLNVREIGGKKKRLLPEVRGLRSLFRGPPQILGGELEVKMTTKRFHEHIAEDLGLEHGDWQIEKVYNITEEELLDVAHKKYNQQREKAATTIQLWYRHLKTRVFLQKLNQMLADACTILQRWWRHQLAFNLPIRRQVTAKKEKVAAAIKLQAVWRKYKTFQYFWSFRTLVKLKGQLDGLQGEISTPLVHHVQVIQKWMRRALDNKRQREAKRKSSKRQSPRRSHTDSETFADGEPASPDDGRASPTESGRMSPNMSPEQIQKMRQRRCSWSVRDRRPLMPAPQQRTSDRRKSSVQTQSSDPSAAGQLAGVAENQKSRADRKKFSTHHGGMATLSEDHEMEEQDEGEDNDGEEQRNPSMEKIADGSCKITITPFMKSKTNPKPKHAASRAAAALLGPALQQDQAQRAAPGLRNSAGMATCEGAIMDPASRWRQKPISVNRALMYGLPQLSDVLEGECDDIGVKPAKAPVASPRPPSGSKPSTASPRASPRAPAGAKPSSARLQPRPGARMQRLSPAKPGSAKQNT